MRPEKQAMVKEISGHLESAEYVFLADFRGMTVEQFHDLRMRLGSVGAHALVVKNALLGIASQKETWQGLKGLLDGPTVMISGSGAVVETAKMLQQFVKEKDRLALKGGVLEGRALSASDVRAMASLPPREVLLAQFVGTVAAPLSRLVGVMSQKLLSIVYVLRAVEDKKAGKGETAAPGNQ